MDDLIPEPIAAAAARGDRTLRFACSNGRENGPYDLDAFALDRGDDRIAPIGLRVEDQTIIATFADPISLTDQVPA